MFEVNDRPMIEEMVTEIRSVPNVNKKFSRGSGLHIVVTTVKIQLTLFYNYMNMFRR